MSKIIRESVKVLLLNDKKEILLLCAKDPRIKQVNTSTRRNHFWFLVGGKIELGESVEQAALREIYEETGIEACCIELGPLVWTGDYDLMLSGVLTRMKEKFIVAHTKESTITDVHMTDYEKKIIIDSSWFSCEQVKDCPDIIYPLELSDYLPEIICGKYPAAPIALKKF